MRVSKRMRATHRATAEGSGTALLQGVVGGVGEGTKRRCGVFTAWPRSCSDAGSSDSGSRARKLNLTTLSTPLDSIVPHTSLRSLVPKGVCNNRFDAWGNYRFLHSTGTHGAQSI